MRSVPAVGGHTEMSVTEAWLAVPAPVQADLAPDGRRLAVTSVRVPAGGEAEEQWLSIVDVDTGAAAAFAGAVEGDGSAVWSPSGDRIAFVTARTGRAQVAVATADGAIVEVVTDLPGGVAGAPAWSPDGGRLAFAAARGRGIDHTRPYRVTRAVAMGDGIGHLDDPPQLWVLDVASGACDRLTDDEWRWSRPRWSPDGLTLAARVSHDPAGRRRGQHLRLVAPDGTWHAPDVPGGFAVVHAWASDGALAVLVVQPQGQLLGSRGQLRVWRDGAARWLNEHEGFGVAGDVYGDSPAALGDSYDGALVVDGTTAWVRVADGGRLGLARIDLAAGEPVWTQVRTGDRSVTPVGAAAGGLVVAEQSAGSPCAVLALDAMDPGAPGRELPVWPSPVPARPAAAEVHRFTVPSPVDGAALEAWFLRTAGSRGPLPTVLMVHGGPNAAFGEAFSIDAQALCAAGFGVVYTNPHGSTGYGDAFTHAAIADWGGTPVRDVLAVIDHAVGEGWADGDRIGMTGNSYGGYLTAWMACTTERFRAAVVENPVTDLLSMYGTSDIGALFVPAQLNVGPPTEDPEPYLRWSPLLHAHRCTTPVLFVVGAQDHRCPPSQAFELHRALHALGTPSEVLVLPGASHEGSTYGPVPGRLAHDEALVEWMTRWLRA